MLPSATVLAISHTHRHQHQSHNQNNTSSKVIIKINNQNNTSSNQNAATLGTLDQQNAATIATEVANEAHQEQLKRWQIVEDTQAKILTSNITSNQQAANEEDKMFKEWDSYVSDVNNKGLNQYSSGNYTGAIKYYDKALATSPNYVVALNNKGLALSGLRNYTGAIKYYHEALATNPNYVEGLNNIGLALYELGNYTGAIKYYDKALAINPNYVNSLNNRGNALNKLGRFAEADNDYSKALAGLGEPTLAGPGKPIAQSYNVSNYFRIFGVADIISTQQDNINDSQKITLTNIGINYKTSHPPNYEWAIKYFQLVLSKDPNYYYALWNMADTLRLEHDMQSTDYLDRAMDINPYSKYHGEPINSPAIDTGQGCNGIFTCAPRNLGFIHFEP